MDYKKLNYVSRIVIYILLQIAFVGVVKACPAEPSSFGEIKLPEVAELISRPVAKAVLPLPVAQVVRMKRPEYSHLPWELFCSNCNKASPSPSHIGTFTRQDALKNPCPHGTQWYPHGREEKATDCQKHGLHTCQRCPKFDYEQRIEHLAYNAEQLPIDVTKYEQACGPMGAELVALRLLLRPLSSRSPRPSPVKKIALKMSLIYEKHQDAFKEFDMGSLDNVYVLTGNREALCAHLVSYIKQVTLEDLVQSEIFGLSVTKPIDKVDGCIFVPGEIEWYYIDQKHEKQLARLESRLAEKDTHLAEKEAHIAKQEAKIAELQDTVQLLLRAVSKGIHVSPDYLDAMPRILNPRTRKAIELKDLLKAEVDYVGVPNPLARVMGFPDEPWDSKFIMSKPIATLPAPVATLTTPAAALLPARIKDDSHDKPADKGAFSGSSDTTS